MVERRAIASGLASAASTWDGGTLPTAADDVFASSFTVTVDTNVKWLSARTTAGVTAVAGGEFIIAASMLLQANVIAGSSICVTFSGAAGTEAFIVGDVTGGGSSAVGVRHNGAGTLNINGNVSGGTAGNSFGVNNLSTGIVNIKGNCTAGGFNSSHAVVNGSTGTINVIGNVFATAASGANDASGIRNNANGNVTVIGNVSGGFGGTLNGGIYNNSGGNVTVTGTVTGGGHVNARGIHNSGSGIVIVTGNVIAGDIGSGIQNATTGTVTVNGDAIGSASSVVYGIQNQSTGQCTLNGTSIGHATGRGSGVFGGGATPIIIKAARNGAAGAWATQGNVVFSDLAAATFEVRDVNLVAGILRP